MQVGWAPLLDLDHQVADRLHGFALRHASFVLVMKGVSALGTSPAYVVGFAFVLAWLLRRGRVRESVFALVTMVGGTILNSLVKAAVDRPRPVFAHAVAHAGFTSFPSGHAQGVAAACGVLLVVLGPVSRRRVVPVAVAWALLIGFSRLALGVHYLSDVVAGFALGGTWVLVLAALFAPGAGQGRRDLAAVTGRAGRSG